MMKTINLADSKTFDEISELSNSSPVLHKNTQGTISSNQNTIDFDVHFQRLNTQEPVLSSTSNLLSQFCNEMFETDSIYKHNYLFKSSSEFPCGIEKNQINLRKIKSSQSEKTNKNKKSNGMKQRSEVKKKAYLNKVPQEIKRSNNNSQLLNYSENYKKYISSKSPINAKTVAFAYKQKQEKIINKVLKDKV